VTVAITGVPLPTSLRRKPRIITAMASASVGRTSASDPHIRLRPLANLKKVFGPPLLSRLASLPASNLL
jgi:hypothetical protein